MFYIFIKYLDQFIVKIVHKIVIEEEKIKGLWLFDNNRIQSLIFHWIPISLHKIQMIFIFKNK